MTLQEIQKKSIMLVLNENINEDIVLNIDDSIAEFLNQSIPVLNKRLDYLVVILEKDRLHSFVTNRELNAFVEILKNYQEKDLRQVKISEFNLKEKFKDQFVLKKQDYIKKVYEIFHQDRADIVLVTDENNRYLGKIKRNEFADTLKLLMD